MTETTTPDSATRNVRLQWIGDMSGAFADLGTFLPLVLGLLVVGTYDASGMMVGFGVFAIATGVLYRRPVPVQPMKVIAALAITGGMTASAVTASGIMIGLVLLVLGVTGLINHLERAVPRTILLGVQIGLGLSLLSTSAGLAGAAPWLGLAVFGLLIAFQFSRLRTVGCLIILGGAVLWSAVFGAVQISSGSFAWSLPGLHEPDLTALHQALETGVLPQLALTITNAILLTAVLAADYFPQDRNRLSARNLALSSGGLNLLLAPFGAIPMCHGAGGLAAQYAQGARTGWAPAVFGVSCLALGVFAGPNAPAWLSLVPMPVIAALLAFAGFQLVNLNRLYYLRWSCLVIVGLTALICVLVNAAAGLFVGVLAEFARSRLPRGRMSSPSGETR
ncbi:MAG TPA: putative sulfate/molybdate transporter [Hyphomicrobiales bacterium]|nr:putative sulfate/molybdate transporter [Hyphomicrobiales bacterium]